MSESTYDPEDHFKDRYPGKSEEDVSDRMKTDFCKVVESAKGARAAIQSAARSLESMPGFDK